jgi:hypothetical protein
MKDEALGHALTNFPASFMEPVYIGDPPLQRVEPVCATGTATLIQLDGRFLAITCHHVVQAFRELAGQPRHMQIGELPLDPDAQLVSQSKSLDVAVLEIQPHQLLDSHPGIGLRREKFFGPRTWPPTPISEEDVISFAGFPGVWREQAGINRFEMFMLSHGASGVESISGTKFVTRLELDKSESLMSVKEITDLGGMSGGPVFRWRRGDLEPQLVGIIYEYQHAYDLLFIRSTRVIRVDGTIDHGIF